MPDTIIRINSAPVKLSLFAAQGSTGAAGPNTITSATTSDGTANLSISNVTTATATVSGTLTASHIHGNLAGSVYAHVRAGEALLKGDPVYVSGFHNGTSTAEVSKADASNAAKMPAIGIMDANLAHNATGHMVITGTITDVNTAGYAVNAELYVASGGGMTATPPTARAQPVARVERVNANNGAIIVKVNGLSASDATASTLVRRDASGGADFSGTVNLNTGVIVDLRFEDYQAAVGATFLYNGTSASDHRIALGAGTTGATLFGAADAAAARTTLGLATADSPTFGGADFFTSTTTTLNVYNTLSGANFERLSFRWVSNVARIGTAKGGTGTARDLVLETDGTERVRVAGTTGIVTTTQLIAQVLQTTGNGFYAGETPIRLGVNNSMYFRALASSDVVSLTNSLGGTNYRDLALRNLTASGTITATTTHPTASAITATQGVYSSFLGANQSGGGFIGCSISGVGVGFAHPTSSSFFPCNASGALTTGVMNLGRADYRFNNYFGTNGNFSGTLAVTGATTLGATTITSAGSFTIGDNATASLNATLSRNGAGALLLNSTNSAGVNIYGKLQFSNDNVADIGNVATHRPRNLYVGTGVFAANITVTGASTLTGGATFGGSTQQAATRIALGAGTTGATLFGAADAAAARAALGIQIKTGTSTGLAAVGTADITGLTGYDLEANTWYKLELQYLWTSTSSNFQINFVTTGTFLRGGTTPAIGQANIGAAALSQSGFINDTSINLRGNVGESRTNIPAFGYAYFKTGTAGTGKVQLQLLAGTTLSTIGSSCAVLTKQN